MIFKDSWIKDPTIFAINRLPAHSDHEWYPNDEDLMDGENSLALSLNGTWKFHYANNLTERVNGFEDLLYNCRDWKDIQVPGHIQLQGFGRTTYVNQMYPWSGNEFVQPGEIPEHENPVGSYAKYFQMPEEFVGHTIHLTFDGVESAFAVWMNGMFVGYSEDSFTPSHFDVTSFVVAGQNKLCVQVYRYSSGSWLEDQDFWRFSGIFRDVTLYALPSIHVNDLDIVHDLYDQYTKAHVSVDMKLLGGNTGTALCMMYDEEGEIVAYKSVNFDGPKVHLDIDLEDIHLWSAEKPYLYDVVLEIADENGDLVEIVNQSIGLRDFQIVDGIMYINGKRIVFYGVNRHEFSMTTGRCVEPELIYHDLLIMKQNNINAVRTSHYPNQSCFYRFCDELGLYVIDETNLETHGSWSYDINTMDWERCLPNDNPKFRNAVLDRARSMYERDKNHASILIWSCGNESYGGKTLQEMAEYFREVDPRRIVHYEGEFQDRRFSISDIESQMYTPADDVAKWLDEHHEKPFILCEYAHAMGNSNGALYKYTDLVDQYEQYQGGFIWDFVDQAILKDGKLHYGGDFEERPSDFDFCGNGIVFADRTLTPKMQEVKYCYQPIDFIFEEDVVTIKNRNLFTDLNEYIFTCELGFEGEIVDEIDFEIDCEPESEITIPTPFYDRCMGEGEYTITLYAYLKETTEYSDVDHEVAHGQMILTPDMEEEEEEHDGYTLRVSYDNYTLGIVGENFKACFGAKGLAGYTYGGVDYLHNRIAGPNFFRPATQNDTANMYGYRYGQWLQASLYQKIQYLGYETNETFSFVKVKYRHELLPNDPTYVEMVYTVFTDGEIKVDMTLYPSTEIIEAPEFSYMLSINKNFDYVTYYGYGPEENYVDRNCGALLGIYDYDVDSNFTEYLMPQECGNRGGVRRAVIEDEYGHGLYFEAEECEFSALRYTPMEIENAKHVEELPEPYQTVIRIGAAQMGIAGDNTWGALTHEEFLLPKGEVLHFTFKMKGY